MEYVVEFFYTGNSGKQGATRDYPSTGYTARKNILPNNDYRDNRSFARATMNIDLGEELSSPEFHQRSVVYTRADWENKNYWYPIPQSEIDRNKELIQNLGY